MTPPRRMTAPFHHQPVMADEIVELFGPVPPGVLLDATVGGGGHARRLLEARPDLRILGLDRDPRALAAAGGRASPPSAIGSRSSAPASTTSDTIMSDLAIDEPLRGPVRPRSVIAPARRAPSGASPTARTPRSTCAWTPTTRGRPPTSSTATPRPSWPTCCAAYGDERFARRIAQAIVAARPIETTAELADIVARRHPGAGPPARRPPGQAHLPGHPHRGQPRARRPARRARRGHRADRARRPGRGARLPLGRGPHRQGPVPPRRDRRLHLPAGPAVRVRRPWPRCASIRSGAAKPTPIEVAANRRAESARLRAVEKLASASERRCRSSSDPHGLERRRGLPPQRAAAAATRAASTRPASGAPFTRDSTAPQLRPSPGAEQPAPAVAPRPRRSRPRLGRRARPGPAVGRSASSSRRSASCCSSGCWV